MKDRIDPGIFVRHFKGGIYEIVGVAGHSETGEDLVIYRSLESGRVFARPKDMFLSPVDREKYPEAKQIMRFEAIGDASSVSCGMESHWPRGKSGADVSAEWAASAARRMRMAIIKARMKALRKCAEESLSMPKYIFFGPRGTYTEHELRVEMAKLWHDETSHEGALVRCMSGNALRLAEEVIAAARRSAAPTIFLSLEDIAVLDAYFGSPDDMRT